jgi:hypothetical protein
LDIFRSPLQTKVIILLSGAQVTNAIRAEVEDVTPHLLDGVSVHSPGTLGDIQEGKVTRAAARQAFDLISAEDNKLISEDDEARDVIPDIDHPSAIGGAVVKLGIGSRVD